jgi:hypothetical protein
LVRQMQLGGDLENAWIMFDHFKCIKGWALCIVTFTTLCTVKF